jgi:phosphoglycolate phosphatase-like HAD superfamily hydrolase
MSGMTDPQIVAEYLAMLDVADGASQVPEVLAHLEVELAAAEAEIRRRGRALPGVTEVLARLAEGGRVLQTLLTGNLAPNALVKVGAFGLQGWLDLEVGAYGSDDADRNRLVPIARQRAATMRGARFAPDCVWVVGDSPNDLACARAGGVRCLLVATGRATYDELDALSPDAIAHDLRDTDAVVGLLAGESGGPGPATDRRG